MTPATRSLLTRAAPSARWGSSLVLFVLLLGMLPTALTAPVGVGAPHPGTAIAGPSAAVVPAAGCSNNGTGNFFLNYSPAQGQVPLTTQLNLTTLDLPTPYTYNVAFGDGTWTNGTVSATCTWGVPIVTIVSHTYTWPQVYQLWATVQGFNGGGGSIGYGFGVYAWGAAGQFPFNITANTSGGPVPLAIHYTAVANASVPSGLTYQWGVDAENGSIGLNTAGFTPSGGNVTVREPGAVSGQLTVQYPNGSVYAFTPLPIVQVDPLLNLQLGVAVTQGSSPFHATFWANATNATGGGVPTIPYTDNWSFGDGKLAGGGSLVTHVYWDNNTINWGVQVTVDARDASGDVIGLAQRLLWLVNNSITNSPPLQVNLTALYPTTAPAPFTMNVTATAWGGSGLYQLQLCVSNGTVVPPATPANCTSVYSSGGYTWDGNTTEIPINFTTPGLYTVTAYVSDRNASTPYADSWVYANITNGVTWAPLVMTTIVTPTNGITAPANVSVGIAIAGGVTPYVLTVWTWPGNVSSGPGPSNSIVFYTHDFTWNGSGWTGVIPFNTSGTWTLGVAVQDAATNFQEQRTILSVGAVSALTLTTTVTPTNGTAPLNVSLGASASGGVAPYHLRIWLRNSTVTLVANVSNWNGASWTTVVAFANPGNWTVVGSVTDSLGNSVNASQSAIIQVVPAAPAAPFVVTAAFVPVASAGSGDFEFSASVAGGVAPYVLVWSFGDGSSAPATISGPITHTYGSPGTYYPSLTVTDHGGHQVTRQLGALLAGPGSTTAGVGPNPPPSWGVALVVAAVLGSALAIAAVVRWAAHRREGLNWVRSFESASDGRTRPPSAP